ncbi:MAG: histidinol-phosphate transaminase [Proteobacteria bacterium]|nr:histidinol-phosphate transaminase [Pseudomonadota bacterium]
MSRFERSNIARMQGYSFGEQPDDPFVVKLNTNENPYPPSPAVQQALLKVDVSRLRVYPPPTANSLRDLIAAQHGLKREQILLTNGGDEALRLAITTFVEPAAAIGYTDPSYSLYPVLADIHDASISSVRLKYDWSIPDDYAARMNEDGVDLSCIVNPHAPSGTLVALPQIETIANALNGVLLLDEAYVDFVDPELGHDSTRLLERCDNLLILRSFSKGYGLAGLRLGYLMGSAELIDPLINKTRDSYNVDTLTQILGSAAFADQTYARSTWDRVRQDREKLVVELTALGLHCPPSQSNFVLAQIPAGSNFSAAQTYQALKESNILVRFFNAPRLDDKLRITVGTADQNQQLCDALRKILQ